MSQKNTTIPILAISVFFAGAMLLASYLLADTGHASTATGVLTAIWFVPFSHYCIQCKSCKLKPAAVRKNSND